MLVHGLAQLIAVDEASVKLAEELAWIGRHGSD
jgi:hypothetical protein